MIEQAGPAVLSNNKRVNRLEAHLQRKDGEIKDLVRKLLNTRHERDYHIARGRELREHNARLEERLREAGLPVPVREPQDGS